MLLWVIVFLSGYWIMTVFRLPRMNEEVEWFGIWQKPFGKI